MRSQYDNIYIIPIKSTNNIQIHDTFQEMKKPLVFFANTLFKNVKVLLYFWGFDKLNMMKIFD